MNDRLHLASALVFFLVAFEANSQSADVQSSAVSDSRPFYVNMFFEKIPAVRPADIRSQAGQSYMQFLPAVGREDIHAAVQDWTLIPGRCAPTGSPEADAIDEIVKRAANTRIVIINEAHDRPRHRAFIQQVATRIRSLGYSVFAAETFSDDISNSNHLPYARWFDGTYSNEPVFGQLIRELKRNDFKLVAYEHRWDATLTELSRYEQVATREEGQANNLVQVFSKMSEDERLLIHAGYSHASEVPIKTFGGEKIAWMASRLKEKTGVNPLTIDQTACQSNSGVTELTSASPRHVPLQFDLVVGHPAIQLENGRPSWRIQDGAYWVDVPPTLRSTTERVLVEARRAGVPHDAVPTDRIMLWPGEIRPLLLPAGKYDISSYFEKSGKQETTVIDVAH